MSDLLPSEPNRFAALTALAILDTPAEERFDRFTRLASLLFSAPIALVTFVDSDRQWFKSYRGITFRQTPRSDAFCNYTVALGTMLVIEDALLDERFADNPLVVGNPHIRFYAGHPLFSDGQPVGSFCIMDRVPRQFTSEERRSLRDLAALVEVEVNHNKVAAAWLNAERLLVRSNAELEQRIQNRTYELETKLRELSDEIVRREAIETSLRHSEDWNRSIIASSYSGYIGADQEGRIVEWNISAERIFGWPRSEAVGQLLSELIVPPSFRSAHEHGMSRRLEAGMGSMTNRKLEVPAMTASGRQIEIEMTLSTHEWQGEPGFSAFITDISERKRVQQQLEDSAERLRTITDNLPVLISYFDSQRRYAFANAVHETWLGVAPNESIGKTMEEAYGAPYYEPQSDALARAWLGETVQCEHEIVHSGSTRFVHSTYLPHIRQGQVVGLYTLTSDATEVQLHNRRLHRLAHTDPLTGLPNRREFDLVLRACAAHPNTNVQTALLSIDVDYFKQINDTYGHAVGDQVLIEFGRRLRAAVRGSDFVARVAGDEFMVLLSDVTSVADVELIARKILLAISVQFNIADVCLPVSATIGVAVADIAAQPAALMEAADKALYCAKVAGRNTYVLVRLGHVGISP